MPLFLFVFAFVNFSTRRNEPLQATLRTPNLPYLLKPCHSNDPAEATLDKPYQYFFKNLEHAPTTCHAACKAEYEPLNRSNSQPKYLSKFYETYFF